MVGRNTECVSEELGRWIEFGKNMEEGGRNAGDGGGPKIGSWE